MTENERLDRERLDRIELNIDALRTDVTATRVSIAHIDERLKQPLHCGLHGTVLFGDGSRENPGLVAEVRELRTAEEGRRWFYRLVIGASIPVGLGGILWVAEQFSRLMHAAAR